jgi:hypothetical protein
MLHKAMVTETAWYWHRNRYTDWQNRTEGPEITQCIYNQLISNKGARTHNGERIVSSIISGGESGYSYAEERN